MEQTNKSKEFKPFTVVARVDAPRKGMAADYLTELLNAGSTPDAILPYDLLDAIEALRRYIQDEHKGEMVEALATIGGLRRVRAILGLKDHAALDPALYGARGVQRHGTKGCKGVRAAHGRKSIACQWRGR